MTTAPVQPVSTTPSASPLLGGTDAFLKLLVAELSHQDPLNAMDPTQMVAQLAQMTTVDEMTKARQSNQAGVAVALLGQHVTAVDPTTGAPLQGVVSGIMFGGDQPQLTVNGVALPLSNIRSVP